MLMEKQEIIPPVALSLLEKEINSLELIRKTELAGNEIYITTYQQSPAITREIGRLREVAFRALGGGSGKSIDIDKYDTMLSPFKQMFVWDPENKQITGAYRYIVMRDLQADSPTSHLFHFEEDFEKRIKPYAIELGRSFVNFNAKKARYALDNVWDGLGHLVYLYDNIEYFFGKITFYPWHLNGKLDLIVEFLEEVFPTDGSVNAKTPIGLKKENVFNSQDGYKSNKKILRKKLKEGVPTSIPPLVNSYMELSETMKYLGATVNVKFGNVVEGAILITIADINLAKKERYIPYFKSWVGLFEKLKACCLK